MFNGRHGNDSKVKEGIFSQDATFLDEFLDGLECLDLEDKEFLIRDFDMDELREYVKELEAGKIPGLDGFSYELY